MAALGKWGPLLGLLIVFGLFGLLLGGWVFATSLNERANREMIVEGNTLRLSKRAVPIDQVVRFTTFESTESFSTPDATSQIAVVKAEFDVRALHPDGSQTVQSILFLWPEMGAEGLEGIRTALEGVLPGKWVPLETFRQPLAAPPAQS